jgi:hypothetical protein
MTFQPGSHLHLVLAGGGHAIFWIAVGAVAMALLLVLSRYELRLVSRRAGLTLLGLRIAAMLVLVTALFEPIAERRYDETVRGRVVLGVDLSASMATADPVSPGEDKRLSPSEPAPTVARREIARRLLDGEWLRKIAADHDVESMGFARDAVAGTPETLVRALKNPAETRDPATLVTDWSGVLARALQGGESGPVIGVILLTDGRQNVPGDPGRGADRLAARGVPIYPVLIGSTTPPKDLAIAAVKAPENVLKGDIATVEVVVKADGFPNVDIPVTLERPGESPLKRTVRGQADGARPTVTFRVPMEKLGPQDLAVRVGPLFGDARPDNDRRGFTIQVADDKARVLLVDSEARWEFLYLYHALKRDPRVAVEAVIFRQPKFSASADTYKNALPPPPPKADDADPLGAYDAIFVGDVEPALMAAGAWARLESFVARRGGTLIFSAGPRAWPSTLLETEAVRKLMPVIDVRPASFDTGSVDPSHPSLAAGVAIMPAALPFESWPMLALADSPELSRTVWSGLPRLPWVLSGRAKPGATTLAAIDGPDPHGNGTVMAAQAYGLGKVLWVGTDSTWRWRFRTGDLYHHRFWGQVVRWAAAGKLAAGADWVRFGPDRSKLPEGETPRLTARFAEGVAGVGPDLLVVARIFKAVATQAEPPKSDGEPLAIVALKPVPGQPRTFAANAPALAAGRYVVRLEPPHLSGISKLGPGSAVEAALEISERQTSELVELGAARDPLDRLAGATGGRVFTVSEADELPGLLQSRVIKKTRVDETTLWDRPWALGLFFGILTFEWVLRKRVGLP